jgi:hypothetical protein
MITELDVLGLVSDRLAEAGVPFMLTGSFALAYYATPRMTRDLDIVVELDGHNAREIIQSSLPSGLSIQECRLAIIERLYKGELPEEALLAHAKYTSAMGALGTRPR